MHPSKGLPLSKSPLLVLHIQATSYIVDVEDAAKKAPKAPAAAPAQAAPAQVTPAPASAAHAPAATPGEKTYPAKPYPADAGDEGDHGKNNKDFFCILIGFSKKAFTIIMERIGYNIFSYILKYLMLRLLRLLPPINSLKSK